MDELLREQENDMKRAADQARATQRLNEYAAVGLDDTQENAELIRDFVNSSAARGWWSREIVDTAIANLRDRLTWRKVEAPPPPAPAESAEVLGNLPNGEPRLPLDVTDFVLRRASVAQIKDWQIRKRAAGGNRYIRPAGRFGSKF